MRKRVLSTILMFAMVVIILPVVTIQTTGSTGFMVYPLSGGSRINFPSEAEGYGTQASQRVGIDLFQPAQSTVMLQISTSNAFEIRTQSEGIWRRGGGSAAVTQGNIGTSFDIRPATGLAPGTYTTNVMVWRVPTGPESGVPVSFTVVDGATAICGEDGFLCGLDDCDTCYHVSNRLIVEPVFPGDEYRVFLRAGVSYIEPPILDVTVRNISNAQATISVNMSHLDNEFQMRPGTSGTWSSAEGMSIRNVPRGETRTFQIRPRTALPFGEYGAWVTVSIGGISDEFGVNFMVYEVTNRIYGTIVESFPAGLTNRIGSANISLFNANTGELIRNTTTNSSGFYEFRNVPNGTYILATYRNGINSQFSAPIVVNNDAHVVSKAVGRVSADARCHILAVRITDLPLPIPDGVEVYLDDGGRRIALQHLGGRMWGLASLRMGGIEDGYDIDKGFGVLTLTITAPGFNISSATRILTRADYTNRIGIISLNVSMWIALTGGTMNFTSQAAGYSQPTAQSTTITNNGNQATQQLTVTAPTGYQVSTTQTGTFSNTITIPSIDREETATFWTRPITGLAAGTHTGNVTVSNTSIQTQSRAVSFTVLSYTISASPTKPNFNNQAVGYTQLPVQTITITNTGNGNVTLNSLPVVTNWTLVQAGNWTTTMTPGQTRTFTIRPNNGLTAGTYNPIITITGSNDTSVQIEPTFTVNPAMIHGRISRTVQNSAVIYVSKFNVHTGDRIDTTTDALGRYQFNNVANGTYTIVARLNGHGSHIFPSVVVNNNTHELNRTLSQISDGSTFRVPIVQINGLPTSIPSGIQVYIESNMGRRDLQHLGGQLWGLGVWESQSIGPLTVVVPGFNVSPATRAVIASDYINHLALFEFDALMTRSISLPSNTMSFTSQDVGYSQPTAQSTTITNTGSQATQQLTVTAPTGYQVSTTQTGTFSNSITISSISVRGTATFWTRPITGLAVGTHTGNVTVSNTSVQTPALTAQSRAVSFTVNAVTTTTPPLINITVTDNLTVIIHNPGSESVSTKGLFLSNDDNNLFLWQMPAVIIRPGDSVQVNDSDSNADNTLKRMQTNFIIDFGETLYLTGAKENILSSFDIPTTNISISLTPNNHHTFPTVALGYGTQATHSIAVNNTGTLPTGNLSIQLSGANAGSFQLNTTTLTSIAVGQTRNFTVTPCTGLSAGTHTATVTVSGVNIRSRSFTVSFRVEPPPKYVALSSTSSRHLVTLCSDGMVWSIDLERLTTTPTVLSRVQNSISNMTAISTGNHTLALHEDGTVWAWGNNQNGQLGDDTTTNRTAPVQVRGISNVNNVLVGAQHSVALREDGTVWTWGSNQYGQLGDGTTTNRATPVQVHGLSNIISISVSDSHTVALRDDGTAWVWGVLSYNFDIPFGIPSGQSTPVQIRGVDNITAISMTAAGSFAIRNDGTVWTWSGIATANNLTQIQGLNNITVISASSTHTLALRDDGTVWAWGENGNGQLGDGTTTNRTTPIQVQGLSNVTSIEAGASRSVALREDGTVWLWGSSGRMSSTGTPSLINYRTPNMVRNNPL
jgi:alpha-tubulin suppressor-like RCC1 family protein